MYDRAPRVVSQTVGSTAVHVGPGTYDANLPDPKKIRNGKKYNVYFVVVEFEAYVPMLLLI